jgi:catechol 2,3-dioxygenase-like lactoylglutathione lyase family enzyme
VPTDPAVQPWTLRSTLIAVSDLDRSVAFYGELGPFSVIAREDGVAVLGGVSPGSAVLLLRETRSLHQARHGQQSLGLRSMTFNVGSPAELDRIESVLRSRDRFTDRRHIDEDAAELVRGRDPDNLPLVFVCYSTDTVGPDYYRTIISMIYSIDA